MTYRLERRVLPTRRHSLCIPHHSQYYAVFTNLQTASRFSFHLPVCFFIYTCVISNKFVLAFLRKPCVFFLWLFMGSPQPLFMRQLRSKGCFLLRQMTLRLTRASKNVSLSGNNQILKFFMKGFKNLPSSFCLVLIICYQVLTSARDVSFRHSKQDGRW